MSVEELKRKIGKLSDIDREKICDDLEDVEDEDKFEFIYDRICPEVDLTMIIDKAVENGNLKLTKLLIYKYRLEPSLLSTQRAIINENYKTAFYVMSFGNFRNTIAIHNIYMMPSKGWTNNIPEKFRYI